MSTTLLDKHTREPLFQQGEPYTLRQFVKIAKTSNILSKEESLAVVETFHSIS